MLRVFIKVFLFLAASVSLCSANPEVSGGDSRANVIDCNAIFEQRKSEIILGIERIDEQQQTLKALQAATQAMLDQKESVLAKREAEVNATLATVASREEEIKRLLERNQEILNQITDAKSSKIAETYAKMKDSKAAPIIANLPDDEAATILFSLEAKTMGSILAKMDPTRAAALTAILQKGPPFEKAAQPKVGNPSTPGATP